MEYTKSRYCQATETGIEDGDGNKKVTPVPRDESI